MHGIQPPIRLRSRREGVYSSRPCLHSRDSVRPTQNGMVLVGKCDNASDCRNCRICHRQGFSASVESIARSIPLVQGRSISTIGLLGSLRQVHLFTEGSAFMSIYQLVDRGIISWSHAVLPLLVSFIPAPSGLYLLLLALFVMHIVFST